jgi:putative transposase
MVRRRWSYPNTARGRPPVTDELEALIVAMGTENPGCGYQRIKGELAGLGIAVWASSVRPVLGANGLGPAPGRPARRWPSFLRQQAAGIVACDFFTVDTVWLIRYDVLSVIELQTRRVQLAGLTTNPAGAWATHQARHLAAGMDERARVVRHLLRDRDARFTRCFDDVWRSIGAEVVRATVRAPNANAHPARRVGTVRRECLDHLLILGPRHVARVLPEFVEHYNGHRPHGALQLVPPDHVSSPAEAEPTLRDASSAVTSSVG